MYRKITICIAAALVAGIAQFADAQGRRPAGAGAQGAASGPVFQRQGSRDDFGLSGQQAFEARRQRDARRAEAEARRQAAELRHREAATSDSSDDARVEHPPNEHAAEEAFSADANAEQSELREGRRDLRDVNSGERSRNE